jgi:hypothetical protein
MYDFLACVGVIARWAQGNLRNLLRSDTPKRIRIEAFDAADTSTEAYAGTCGAATHAASSLLALPSDAGWPGLARQPFHSGCWARPQL